MRDHIIQVLIVDDNCDSCELLSQHFNLLPDIKVVGISHNGIDGFTMFQERKAEFVLLDMIMPFLDGLGFLERMREEMIATDSKIVMLSEISQESIVRHAFHLGAHYYMLKPFDLDFLTNRFRTIVELSKKSTQQTSPKEILRPSDVPSNVAKLLIDSGLPVHTLGYKYFDCAINYLIDEKSDVFSITKSVYPYVASKYDTSSSCVDKAMRHSLSLAFHQNPTLLSCFLEHMNYKDVQSKPSNSEYISLILTRLKNNSLEKVWS